MSGVFDLAILGSGFGGSLLAMAARRLGKSVLLLERGSHPRFAIGESTSPLANLLLEELATEYDLPRLLPLTGYGAWQRAYPEIPVGLKRGFTYYAHAAGESFAPDSNHERQLLVAASPYDEVADTHWYRAEFDHFLVREAAELGAEYVDRVVIESAYRDGGLWTLDGTRGGRTVRYHARFLVDATGPRGALSRLVDLLEEPFSAFPRTQALFSHFTDVPRFAEQTADGGEPPYPPDDAALHHVFGGGWMWVLRFNNGVTSAGFAVEDWLAAELRLEERGAAWERILGRFPSIRDQFADARPVLPFIHSARLSYRCGQVTGDGWALLPSAAAFIDPFFSTGFPLTLLGIHRLARLLREPESAREPRLAEYAANTRAEAETAARLVAASYALFGSFPAFAALSMLYFVAASYSEMARRLGRAELAAGFLLQKRPGFREAFTRHCERALSGTPSTDAEIYPQMEPFNIAGLCDPEKRNWYGVDLGDVVRGAPKLDATPGEVEAFIARMGW